MHGKSIQGHGRGVVGKMHRSANLALLFLTAGLMCAPAFSQVSTTAPATGIVDNNQTADIDDRNSVSSAKGGSFLSSLPIPAFGYGLSASVNSYYQSNVLRRPAGTLTPPGQSKSDFRITPQLSGSLNLPLGRQSIYATGSVGKDYYTKNTSFGRERLSAAVGANLSAARCRANLAANYARQQSNLDSSATFEPNTQETIAYSASVGCGAAIGLSPNFSYRRSQARNSATNRFVLDLNNNVFSAGLTYARPSLGTITLNASRSNNSYINQLFLITNGTAVQTVPRGVRITNFGAAYQRKFGPRFGLDVGISRNTIDPTLPGLTTSHGTAYHGTLDYTPSSRLGLSIGASRNTSVSPNVNALFFSQTLYSANLSYRLTPSIRTSLNATSSRRSYSGNSALPGIPSTSGDTVKRIRANIGWSPGGRFDVSSYLAYQKRSAADPLFDFSDVTTGVQLSFRL